MLDALLARLSRLVAGTLIRQIKAGADAVQVFDTWAGLLPRREWQRLARPHLCALLETVRRAGAKVILFLHRGPHLVEDYAGLPAAALAVDGGVDLPALQRRHGHRLAVQGNIDPAVLAAGASETRAAAETLLRDVRPMGHIVNLGHGILPQTPLESVDALVEAVHAEAA